MVWIKICANTTFEDAQLALDLGADALGFVFASSTRRVTPAQAGAITARLEGPAELIGVFQNIDFLEIRDAILTAGLTGVQLHGTGDPEIAERLRGEFGAGITIAQTIHWVVDAENAGQAHARQVESLAKAAHIDRVLVDSKVGSALGGTGRTFDWKAAHALFAEAQIPMIVAGGLGPSNVAEAIEKLKPWGVDVASGVESAPAKKDPERLRQFIDHARTAWQNL